MLSDYIKLRLKSYIYILLGFSVGLILSKFLFDKPEYAIGITIFFVTVLIIELVRMNKWLTLNNK